MDVALQRQHQCHGEFGHCVHIDAGRAGETNATGSDQIRVVAFHAGANRPYELRLLGDREQLVSPRHGDDDHIA
jgi:hypothetical protein